MLVGAMLAASDLVAVLAGMKELGAYPSLFMIISLDCMIDGCAVVLLFHSTTSPAKLEVSSSSPL